jgi:integrase
MARPVKQAHIEGRGQRRRLKPGRQAHWQTLVPGRVHLGYQRWPEDREGRWIVRRYTDGAYYITPLGTADDVRESDGDRVLDFAQAYTAARALVDAPATATTRLTVRSVVQSYIEHKKAEAQPVGDLISRTQAHIYPTLGSKLVSELTAKHLRNWLADLASMPAMVRTSAGAPQRYAEEPKGDDKRARQASANRVLTMLKAALNHSFDEGHVSNRDAWGRKLKPFRGVEVARVRYLTVAEAQRLINASDPEFRPLVRAALETGARYSELTRLEVHDFNPDSGTVHIARSKSGKARNVVLTGQGSEFFREVTVGRPGSDLIFKRDDGEPWTDTLQCRRMDAACERAKIAPPIGFHGLRHTWASLSVMAGMPLMVVAKNLGHANTRMVEKHYGHLDEDYVAEQIRDKAPVFGIEGRIKSLH